MNVLEKVNEVRALVKKELGNFSDKDLEVMIRHISKGISNNKYKSRITRLTADEIKLYELFYKNKLNPDTVYKWFLVAELPEEEKEKIRVGLWSFRRAYVEKRKLCAYDDTTTEDFINAIIRCVEMFYVEPDIMRDEEVEP